MPQEQTIMDMLADEMATGRLVLPTLPEVALSIGDLISREDVDAVRVAEEISKDPAIAARLLASANTIGARGLGKPADSLKTAVTRLGLSLTRVLVNRMAIEQMFCAKSAVLNRIMKRTWSRSLEVAALSRVLARHCTTLNHETAMLAGLVHKVGVLPIVRLIDQHHQIEEEDHQIEQLINRLQADAGSLVLKAWDLPAELIAIPAMVCDFGRTHEGDADYGDVISVAILQLNMEDAEIDRYQVPAFARLGISPEVETTEMPKVYEAYERSLEMLTG